MGADPAPAKIVADGPAMLRTWEPPALPAGMAKDELPPSPVVRAIIDATGKVTAARIPEPGEARFDDAALAAVKTWIFAPALADGQPVPCCLDIEVKFADQKARKKGQLQMPMFDLSPRTASAEPLNSPAGDYPAVLTERKLPGIVRFRCVVTPEGRALNPRIRGASHADFVLPALEALKQWTFSPAMEGDLAVRADMEAQMTFDIIGSVPSRAELLATNGLTSPDGTAPEDTPGLLTMADPVQPFDLLLAGEGGSATVEFTVGSQGQVTDIKVIEATQPAYGAALVAAAGTWEFQPALKDGRAINVTLRKKMAFPALPKETAEGAAGEARLIALLRSGSNIGSARGLDGKLEPLYQVPAVYPSSLRGASRPAGRAMIDIVIDRDGRARLPKVASASQEEFGWAAATAAAQWVFKPVTRGGQPAEAKVRIPFEFAAPEE